MRDLKDRDAILKLLGCERISTSKVFKKGLFTFDFYNYYYRVKGIVPKAVAEELYAHPLGKLDIRVAGHCGCPPPFEWLSVYAPDGRVVLNTSARKDFNAYVTDGIYSEEQLEKYLNQTYIFDDNLDNYLQAIELYHIDSEAALVLFFSVLERHGLL